MIQTLFCAFLGTLLGICLYGIIDVLKQLKKLDRVIKVYTKLPVPESSWGKKTWRRYTPQWLKYFIDGVKNIIRWMPTIYKDRDWDDYYILRMLQKKIEHQRAYLVKHNRHLDIEQDNFWMTICLNLIEREIHEYYATECQNYSKTDIKFIPCEDRTQCYTLKTELLWERYDDYFKLYPSMMRKYAKEFESLDKEHIAFRLGRYNQKKARTLLFKILDVKSNQWWD